MEAVKVEGKRKLYAFKTLTTFQHLVGGLKKIEFCSRGWEEDYPQF